MHLSFTATHNRELPWVAVRDGYIVIQAEPVSYPIVCYTHADERIEIGQITPTMYTLLLDGVPVTGPAHPIHIFHTVSLLATTAPVCAWKEGIHQTYLSLPHCWVVTIQDTTYVVGRCTGYTRALLGLCQFTFDTRLRAWNIGHGIASSFVRREQLPLSIDRFLVESNAVLQQTPTETV